MTQKNKLFNPIDGVIVEIEKEQNTAGIELPESSKKKNEGIIISEKTFFSLEKMKLIKDNNESIKVLQERFKKGTKIKFLEGYPLEEDSNLYFVRLDKIIGIY